MYILPGWLGSICLTSGLGVLTNTPYVLVVTEMTGFWTSEPWSYTLYPYIYTIIYIYIHNYVYIYIHIIIYIGFVSKWRAPIHRHCVIKKLSLKTSDGMRYPCFGLFILEKTYQARMVLPILAWHQNTSSLKPNLIAIFKFQNAQS